MHEGILQAFDGSGIHLERQNLKACSMYDWEHLMSLFNTMFCTEAKFFLLLSSIETPIPREDQDPYMRNFSEDHRLLR